VIDGASERIYALIIGSYRPERRSQWADG